MLGSINERALYDTLIVFDAYPPYAPVGDSLLTNYVWFPDTSWTDLASRNINNSSAYIPATLWLEGKCSGRQTYCSALNTYLVGDITYAGTTPGLAPDDPQGMNTVDYLGIVSERKIYIKYGHHDSFIDRDNPPEKKPNCNNIYIYAALCALGDGSLVNDEFHMQEDGEFTFEYQFPHFSTENVEIGGELFDYIDLHLGQWKPTPPTHYWPWPAKSRDGFNGFWDRSAPDYPWYNPLWPEQRTIRERGEIKLYGAISQRRRGYVHRSGNPDLDNGIWDPDKFKFGLLPTGGTNSPSGDGRGIGYGKDYHFDDRFNLIPPPDFPEVNLKGKGGKYNGVSLIMKTPPSVY
jgi:hypothetical protein